MAIYKTYSPTLSEHEATVGRALDYARNYYFGEEEATEQAIGHARHVDTINGIGIYYDYAADYYFFTDESGE